MKAGDTIEQASQRNTKRETGVLIDLDRFKYVTARTMLWARRKQVSGPQLEWVEDKALRVLAVDTAFRSGWCQVVICMRNLLERLAFGTVLHRFEPPLYPAIQPRVENGTADIGVVMTAVLSDEVRFFTCPFSHVLIHVWSQKLNNHSEVFSPDD